jgi:peptide-methionine (R)-S-oxide reductase
MNLKDKLTKIQFHVTQESGTEPPFSGTYNDEKANGVYQCVCCDSDLFSSNNKFDSGTGWPSFYDSIKRGSLELKEDSSDMMIRVEVSCGMCGSHLGHVFRDGPQPSGLRYCINSASLFFKKS